MKFASSLLVLLIIGFLLPVHAAAHRSEDSKGDSVTVERFPRSLGLASIDVVRFDPGKVTLKLVTPKSGKRLQRVVEMPQCVTAVACANASFFKENGEPLGLMVSQGKMIQPLRRVPWSVFWIDDKGNAGISNRREYRRGPARKRTIQFAVQSGPRLLRKGRIPSSLKWSLARRTTLGITADGVCVLVVTSLPMTLEGVAEFGKEKLNLVEMVNLDGGSSTQLMVPDEGISVNGVPVAVGLAIYR